ncbi:hypothetical protein BDV26DRAFT_273335 [Aspergillus bertholletiae]|uniref:Uncharacterized protein n=1 Tax=Aspergillus bertholletiae TaxID=1226010 RepID=A0A5N7ASH9_9EURO|nr:hypothetical protein BDV26DRAFT_273335 [Aspergillus bertholletiae]
MSSSTWLRLDRSAKQSESVYNVPTEPMPVDTSLHKSSEFTSSPLVLPRSASIHFSSSSSRVKGSDRVWLRSTREAAIPPERTSISEFFLYASSVSLSFCFSALCSSLSSPVSRPFHIHSRSPPKNWKTRSRVVVNWATLVPKSPLSCCLT